MTNPPTNAAFDLAALAWGGPPDDPSAAAALRQLGRVHRAEVRADLERVHPTWLARAVQDESPAIRAIVAGFGPPAVKAALLSAFGTPLAPERSPHPEVLEWVLALWAERLVGGEPERADDPPIIVALARLSLREAYRLAHVVGRTKRRLADDPEQSSQVRALVGRDVEMADRARLGLRRRTALLGLTTAARLLADCETFRARWALQRLPYPVVKQIRRLASAAKQSAAVARLEGQILEAAWDHLARAGRLATPFPAGPDREAP